jgi:hypothetical protein
VIIIRYRGVERKISKEAKMAKRLFLFIVTLLIVLSVVNCEKRQPFSAKQADFDGLIVNAVEQDFQPALINKIFSLSGYSIYDDSKIKKKVIFERGCGEYALSIDEAKTKLGLRGVKNPLIVKAAGIVSPKDILVSDVDAVKILVADKNAGFLADAQVAFVYKKK